MLNLGDIFELAVSEYGFYVLWDIEKVGEIV